MRVPWERVSRGVCWEIKVLRLAKAFRIAHGSSVERRVLRVRVGEAFGEAPFVPYYEDAPEAVRSWLEAWQANAPLREEEAPRVVRLAFDVLRRDLEAQEQGLPLWKQMGLREPNQVRGGRSVGIPEGLGGFGEELRALGKRFGVLKLKMGGGNVERDLAIARIAEQEAPNAVRFVDANGGWSVEEAAYLIPRLADLGIRFVEQPLHAKEGLEAWKALRRKVGGGGAFTLPLFADESVQSAADLDAFAGVVEGVNIKLLKCVGFASALEMVTRARHYGMQTLLGCMIESAVGVSAAAHLAGEVDWIDLDGHLYVAEADVEGLQYDGEGRLWVPDQPGIGVRSVARS